MNNKNLRRTIIAAILVICLTALLFALRNAFIPVFIALFFAYLLDPLIDRLEMRGLHRSAAILILAGILIVLLTVLGGFLAINAQQEIVKLYDNLPGYLSRAQGTVAPLLKERLGVELPHSLGEWIEEASSRLENINPSALKPVSEVVSRIFSSSLAVLVWFLGLVIIPVFLFYFLRDWDTLKLEAVDLIPRSYRDWAVDKLRQIDEVLGAFVRGQLTVCLLLGLLYSLGLMSVRIDLAVVIGMSAGLLFIVPYLGTVLGVIAASFMALLGFGLDWHILGVWAVFGGVQILEGTVITPRVLGDKVGLSPVAVIFAIMAGAELLGLLGVLLAVPVVAVLNVFFKEGIQRYRKSIFYLEKPSEDDSV